MANPIAAAGFLKLPAELRNEIYELVFDSNNSGTIDLLAATPPSKNLLLVCKEIYNEAAKLYNACYRNYWSENHFTLDRSAGPRITESQIKLLDAEGLDHIKSLRVPCSASYKSYYKLLDPRGGWVIASDEHVPLFYYRLRKGRPQGEPGPVLGVGYAS